MIDIIMHGYSGKMGKVVCDIVANEEACQIVAGIDAFLTKAPFPTFQKAMDCTVKADVIIDFSTATAIPELLAFAKKSGIPLVLCTTALTDETQKELEETAKSVAILKSANMSLGVNLVMELVQKAATILTEANFDIEIVERHHNQKIDAPSGTAIAIADAMNEALKQQFSYTYDRSQVRVPRGDKEIGIHAVRGGNIVGDHEVIFAGRDEVIEINHKATSKEVFAVGAVGAAKYLAGKPPKLYSMADVMK
ncbi:MAG: 4-hydroxy-tetrahydrodipicolinate reductase [Bacillota bacterium]